MARRVFQVRHLPGFIATALVVLVSLGTLVALLSRAEGGGSALSRYDWLALRFTVYQAALSALLSVVLAVPVARALARRSFPGRGLLITLLGAPFILPTLVAILGLIAVFGKNGVVAFVAGWLGLPPPSIYGLQGILIAHVFFNLPLATRLILQGWLAVPSERFRLAASLGFGPRDVARHIEWQMLRAVAPGAFMVIFLICMTSFSIALALGGGPKATTVELAIYEAFRFDFDLARAARLALLQFGLGAVIAVAAFKLSLPSGFGAGLGRVVVRHDAARLPARLFDGLSITLASVFLLAPLLMLVIKGGQGLFDLPESVWRAALRSVLVAAASTLAAVLMGLSVAALVVGAKARVVELIGTLTIVASPLVVGTGLFIMVLPFAKPSDLALPVTALVNAVMALPFLLRALVPALSEVETNYGALADSLGMRGGTRLRRLWLPLLARPLGFGAGLAAALSMGDLGVITLFAAPEGATLPMQIYRLMSSYRMEQAMGAALLLLILSLGAFALLDRGGRTGARS